MNLLNASASDLKASGTGNTSPSGNTGVTSFLAILGLAESGNTNKEAGATVSQNETDLSAGTVGGSFPALTTSDMKGLLEALATIAGGADKATETTEGLAADGSGVGSGSATVSGETQEQQVENLILALLALVVAKIGSSSGSVSGPGADDRNAAEAQGSSSSAARKDTAKNATASDASTSSDSPSTQGAAGARDQETLETLALLIFHSLQAVLQRQNPVEPTTGNGADGAFPSDDKFASEAGAAQGAAQTTGEIPGGVASESGPAIGVNAAEWQKIIDQAVASGTSQSNGAVQAEEAGVDKGRTIPSEDGGTAGRLDVSSPNGDQDPLKQLFEGASIKVLSPKEKAGGLLNEVSDAGKTASVPEAGDKSSGPSVGLTPTGDAGQGTGTLALVIKGPQGSTPYTGPDGVTGEMTLQNGTGVSQQGDNTNDSVATTIIHDLSALLEGQGGNASKGDTGDKEQQSGRGENYQQAGGSDFGVGAGAVQEQSGKVSDRTTAGESVDKFQQVIDQFSGKTGQHDLTVKLDVGSEGSLVLGMKDLGQTVTVEVRASHDAMVNLLQSQKDTIIRHLEGKDVHANIVIDPNASGTPEKRDRRDTEKQRTFPTPQKEDEGFGELLEILV